MFEQTFVADNPEFRINDVVANNQRIPEVVANGSGRAFVAWESNQTGIAEVYGSYVEQAGPLGSVFPISNPSAAEDSVSPGVAFGLGGRAITVFRSGNSHVETKTFDLGQASGTGASITDAFTGKRRQHPRRRQRHRRRNGRLGTR